MYETSKTELVYGDLCQLYRDINENRRNPRLFRLAFETYIFKSQQLTEAMRSDFHQKTGLTWTASKFEGWNGFSSALKKIRNAALHGYPIVLDEAVLSIYPNVRFATDDEEWATEQTRKKYRVNKGRSFVDNAFSDRFITTGLVFLREERINQHLKAVENYVFPIKEFVFYELRWELLKRGVFRSLGQNKTVDALKLVLKSFPVLEAYMTFYRGELQKNLYDVYKSDYFVRPERGMGWIINPKYGRNQESMT